MYSAARGLDIRLKENPELKLGKGVQQAYQNIRDKVPYQPGDAWWAPEIEKVKKIVLEGDLAFSNYS